MSASTTTTTFPRACFAILVSALACAVWSPSWAQRADVSPRPATSEPAPVVSATEALPSIERMVTKRIAAMDEANALQLQAMEGHAELKARRTDLYKDTVANAQKSVDWWLAMLAILLATVGVVVPLLLLRQLKERHAHDIANARAALQHIEGHHSSSQNNLTDLKNMAAQLLVTPTNTGT